MSAPSSIPSTAGAAGAISAGQGGAGSQGGKGGAGSGGTTSGAGGAQAGSALQGGSGGKSGLGGAAGALGGAAGAGGTPLPCTPTSPSSFADPTPICPDGACPFTTKSTKYNGSLPPLKGTLGEGDLDVYWASIPMNGIDSKVILTSGLDAQTETCVYLACENNASPFVTCPNGTKRVAPNGAPGCCRAEYVTAKVLCDPKERALAFLTVGGATCSMYALHFDL